MAVQSEEEPFPQPEEMQDGEYELPESRKVFRITRDLFAATTNRDFVGILLGRARLEQISGDRIRNPHGDRKMWKLTAWFYLGLYHDAIGEEQEAKECMKMAMRLCHSSGNADDLLLALPMLHMTVRDWFDDDDFEPILEEQPDMALIEVGLGLQADAKVVESIQKGISKLNIRQIRSALKTLGISMTGTKDEVQKRLFLALIERFNEKD
eukprot:CAMPEP_0202445738 /NCGR_PEP_ID=MMETSP1360-20130828/4485_1 /ASSEMBLY_ACC=CAM_ASM_000848 /TAXON_ID=515479 /ORGANISM="Licmophora paradoxa, Strain CCMP2313" /LENGTH=209 /DNA_ID=CAMNT_0049062091 /DNA_START=1 /DNA_END=630 /DNA_ORIENTATION=+